MKKLTLILLSTSIILSCQKDDELLHNQINETCKFRTEITPPNEFILNKLSSIEWNGGLHEIQFLTNESGYILGSNPVGGYAEIYKTLDGGITWMDLQLSIRVNPINMFFLNEEEGFISHYGSKGNMLKTIDGGQTWTELNFPNLNGNMYHLQKDNFGHLYAVLSDLHTETVLIKSIDKGNSWQIINDSPELHFSLLTFSFQVFEDRIFISAVDGGIVVTDLSGNQIKTIQTNLKDIWDLEIIDENNLVVASSEKTIKSKDGGISWNEIYSRSARILDFKNADEGIMIMNKSYCPTDVYQANDVIAYTENGGLEWIESQQATNTMTDYADSQIRNNGHILIIGKNLYELKK